MHWAIAAIVILVWGITFVNTRAPLGDFSALEIQFGRFALAWAMLWGYYEIWRRCGDKNVAAPACKGVVRGSEALEDEWLFAALLVGSQIAIVGVVFAVVFLDERLTTMSAFGGLCIVVGVAIAKFRV